MGKTEYVCVDEIGCEAWLRGGDVPEENKFTVTAEPATSYENIKLKAEEKHGVPILKVIEEKRGSHVFAACPWHEPNRPLMDATQMLKSRPPVMPQLMEDAMQMARDFSRSFKATVHKPTPRLAMPRPKVATPTRLETAIQAPMRLESPIPESPCRLDGPQASPRAVKDLTESEKQSIYLEHKDGVGFRVLEKKYNIKSRHGMNAQKICMDHVKSTHQKRKVIPAVAVNAGVAVAVSA